MRFSCFHLITSLSRLFRTLIYSNFRLILRDLQTMTTCPYTILSKTRRHMTNNSIMSSGISGCSTTWSTNSKMIQIRRTKSRQRALWHQELIRLTVQRGSRILSTSKIQLTCSISTHPPTTLSHSTSTMPSCTLTTSANSNLRSDRTSRAALHIKQITVLGAESSTPTTKRKCSQVTSTWSCLRIIPLRKRLFTHTLSKNNYTIVNKIWWKVITIRFCRARNSPVANFHNKEIKRKALSSVLTNKVCNCWAKSSRPRNPNEGSLMKSGGASRKC